MLGSGNGAFGTRLGIIATRTSARRGWATYGRQSASAKKVEALEEQAIANGRYPFIDEWRETRLRALSDKLNQPGSRADDRFQLNHILQAENAFRRQLITAARYKTAIERLEGKRDALAVAAASIVDLAASSGFMPLELDPAEADKAVSVRFVPESIAGSAFGNWKLDSKQACRAYGEAYYRSDAVDGKLKFVRQRLWILLSSLVANPNRWDADRIGAAAREVALLEKAARAGREGQAGDHAADLHNFLTALTSETKIDRDARLRLLGRFAREDFRDALPDGVDSIHESDRASGRSSEGSPLTRVIPASPTSSPTIIGAGVSGSAHRILRSPIVAKTFKISEPSEQRRAAALAALEAIVATEVWKNVTARSLESQNRSAARSTSAVTVSA